MFSTVIGTATLLCSLVAGLLFAFSVVVMPGIKRLDDQGFIRAFQVIDKIIQENQPVFMLVWVGSILALILAAVLGLKQLDTVGQTLILVATAAYLFGVQLPTFTVNVPLNNELQTLDTNSMDDGALKEARGNFEPRWNRSNVFRTVLSILTAALLIVLLVRL